MIGDLNKCAERDGEKKDSDREEEAKINTARYHYKGRMDLSLKSCSSSDVLRVLHLENVNASYFMCGPEGFMEAQKNALLGYGVSAPRIHSEGF